MKKKWKTTNRNIKKCIKYSISGETLNGQTPVSLSTIMFMYRNRRDHLFGMLDENNISTSAVNEL